VLWKQSYECPRYGRHHLGDEDAYSGPTATPEFDPATGLLYTLSTDGDLNCWDARDNGRRVWGVNLYSAYEVPRRPEVGKAGSRRDYGYITAPLVHGDWLLVAVGAREGHLMAFDKKDGTRRWVSECAEPAGHCGGLAPLEVEGVPCVASFTLRKLVVIRLDAGREGKTVAEHDWVTDFGNNIASPAVFKNFVLITSRYNHGAMCKLEVTLRGAKKVWEAPYASGACTPVIQDGHVYWTSEKMHCLDFATGKLKWAGGSFGSPGSCVAAADGKLIVWGDRGKLALVEPADQSPDRYKELARVGRLSEAQSWPHVVLADGRLYGKDRDGNVTCFLLKPR
jgi:outer membrane protein assembly factor BamB